MARSDPQLPASNGDSPDNFLDTEHAEEWIRAHVGRQIVIGCALDLPEALMALLYQFHELRLILTPSATATDTELESAVLALLRQDPHALLFWVDDSDVLAEIAARLYRVCERTGALDDCFVALVGPVISRRAARSLAFEDGFAWAGDIGDETTLMSGIFEEARTPAGATAELL
jgi:hypothetical protein